MLIINIIGLALIGLIVWWFWLYKPGEVALTENDLVVRVEDGTYQPSHIKVPANKSVTLLFKRIDASPCAETVIFPNLDISETLALNKLTNVELPALKAGEYPFHCQMQMYRGTLVVE